MRLWLAEKRTAEQQCNDNTAYLFGLHLGSSILRVLSLYVALTSSAIILQGSEIDREKDLELFSML